MILETVKDLTAYRKTRKPMPVTQWDRVLMVSPEYFNVEYAINPYMVTASGKLQTIDRVRAQDQWQRLKDCYQDLGFEVFILPGVEKLVDMVFAANQSFPFIDGKTQTRHILLSRMRSEQRQAEVSHFKRWYEEHGYSVVSLKTSAAFEGNGDALIQPLTGTVWGGYGPRTDRSVYEELSERFALPIVPLELKSRDFYHLDTCFSILNHSTVAIQPRAFSNDGLRLIREGFEHVIEVDYEENISCFACNCHSPNGKDVILHKGASRFASELAQRGFVLHEIDTSEFMKSGGSVFCMKMMLFS